MAIKPRFAGFIGEPVGIRTRDPLIKSQVLYRLSYGLLGRHMGPAERQGQYCVGVRERLYIRRRAWRALSICSRRLCKRPCWW